MRAGGCWRIGCPGPWIKGRNGAVLLNNTTVFDDALANVLTGAGGRDWFFDGTADAVNANNRFGREVSTPVP